MLTIVELIIDIFTKKKKRINNRIFRIMILKRVKFDDFRLYLGQKIMILLIVFLTSMDELVRCMD